MTRPGSNARNASTSSASSRRSTGLGRSSLWSDEEDLHAGPEPRRAGADRVDSRRRLSAHSRPLRAEPRRGAFGHFLHRYGWRAYAIPALIALTVLVVLQIGRKPTVAPAASVPTAVPAATSISAVGAPAAAPQAPATSPSVGSAAAPVASSTDSTTGQSDATSAAATALAGTAPADTTGTSPGPVVLGSLGVAATAALPAGENFVAQGKGTWHMVKGTSPVMGSGGAKYTFSVEVEDGIEPAAADQDFAAIVDATLADPRSWIGSGHFQLQRVDTGTPSFRVSLTSQLTVRNNALCGWDIHYEASCYARGVQRVAINDARWARGAVSFDGDRAAYRVYAVNHEVGHALGYVHRPCPTNGGPAPVMMQQSWSTADNDLAPLNPQLIPMDGNVCNFNPYPFPAATAAVAGG